MSLQGKKQNKNQVSQGQISEIMQQTLNSFYIHKLKLNHSDAVISQEMCNFDNYS